MADNIVLNPGSGGKTVRTDQIAGVDIPESKIVIGADGVDDGYVSSANPLPVSASALPLPAGASTAANQTTIIGHVDNVESLLGTIDTDTGILAAKTGEYDTGAGTDTVAMLGIALPASGGAVAGGTSTNPLRTDPTGSTTQPVSGTVTVTATDLDIRSLASGTDSVAAVQSGAWSVSLAAAVPAGDNAIGRVKLTDGTLVAGIRDLTNTDALNVAVVDANGDQITSFGGSGSGTEYAEDTAASSGEMVTMAGVVRQDTPASLVDLTGDRTELSVDANGRLYVNVHDGGNSLTVDGSVSVTGALPAGTNNIGDVDIASMPDEGQQLMAASISVAIASDQSAVPVSGTVAATQSGSWTVDLGSALPAGTNNIGDVDIASLPNEGQQTMLNSISVAIASDQSGVPVTDNGGSLTVDGTVTANAGTGTFTVDATDLDIRDLTSASDSVAAVGDVAHDGVDSGNPLKLGAKAIAHGSNPTAVAANDRTNLYANRHGIPWAIGGHPNVISRTVHVTDTDGAQTDASIAGAIGTGTKIVVTRLSVLADNANTADVRVKVGFGTTTLPADSASGADGIIADQPGVPAGGGFTLGDGSGVLAVGGDGAELRLTCEDPAGGAITVSFSYYTIES